MKKYDCDESVRLKAKEITEYVLLVGAGMRPKDISKADMKEIVNEVCWFLEND